MIILLLAIIGDAGNILADKYNFLRSKVTPQQYNVGLFLFLTIFSSLSLVWFYGDNNFSLVAWLWLIAVVIVATAWNIGYARALAKENLEEFESFILFTPLITTLFAWVFLHEQNEKVIVASIVASVAFIIAHIKKNHLVLHKQQKYLAGVVILMSFESILVKQALVYFSPALLYTVRTLIVFIIFAYIYRRSIKTIPQKLWVLFAFSGAMGTLFKIAQFAGFNSYGVIYTTLVLMLAPFIILFFDKLWLKEKLHWKNMASIIVIIGAIIYATI